MSGASCFVATKVQLATQIFCGVRTKVQLAWNIPAYGLSFHRGQLAAALLSGIEKKDGAPSKGVAAAFFLYKKNSLNSIVSIVQKKSRARYCTVFSNV